MWIKFVKWLVDKLSDFNKVELAEDLLKDIQTGATYSISDTRAKEIIETVVKSSGNKVVDYILKD